MAFDSDSPNENRNKAPKTLDDLHGIAQGPGCSELIKVSEFIDSFSANHLATGAAFVYLRETTEVNKALTIHRMMSVDDETFRSLSVAMEHSQLMCGCEEVDCTVIPDNDDGWISLRIRKSDLQRSRPWHASSSCMLRLGSLKTDLRLPAFPEPPGPRIVEGGPRVRWLEATLTVSLFRTPPTGTPAFVDLIGQFAVLGSTELQSLVNRFKCTSGHARPGDFADHPEALNMVKPLLDRIKGYFIFIEDTFYCSNWDYPNVIAKWISDNKLGDFEVRDIVGVKFRDLSIRLGRPYVYMHNGDCQHHVVFNDIRLLNEQRDDSDINNYPMLLGQRVHQQV
ncbi:snRNA-activating protein complex subunit 3-like isoform X2 [Varroa jacobsoni]|nr:snRNA-activating protein complex subunit 3-like isoform X2 [Varroa destructor]XP_022690843.1 snRNA-activating protein complex subunit 3-like isoform X2 [Varroa jacobsoni]